MNKNDVKSMIASIASEITDSENQISELTAQIQQLTAAKLNLEGYFNGDKPVTNPSDLTEATRTWNQMSEKHPNVVAAAKKFWANKSPEERRAIMKQRRAVSLAKKAASAAGISYKPKKAA